MEYEKKIKSALERYFGADMMKYLMCDDKVIEIMINDDNSLFIEKLGEQSMLYIGKVQPMNTRAIINTLASYHQVVVDAEQTILECEIPFCGSRFLGKIPPTVSNPTVTIRKKPKSIYTLKNYLENKIISEKQHELIIKAIHEHKNILIVGGTGTGKTTLTNAIIDSISIETPDDRILIIEDTAEIQCKAKNRVISRTTKKVSMQDLVKSSLRERPDRVLIGEIRGKEALDLITIWNTGHPGGIATVHANSAYEALARLERLLAQANSFNMQDDISKAINVIIFIKKTKTGRKVEEIIAVKSYDEIGKKYDFESYT